MKQVLAKRGRVSRICIIFGSNLRQFWILSSVDCIGLIDKLIWIDQPTRLSDCQSQVGVGRTEIGAIWGFMLSVTGFDSSPTCKLMLRFAFMIVWQIRLADSEMQKWKWNVGSTVLALFWQDDLSSWPQSLFGALCGEPFCSWPFGDSGHVVSWRSSLKEVTSCSQSSESLQDSRATILNHWHRSWPRSLRWISSTFSSKPAPPSPCQCSRTSSSAAASSDWKMLEGSCSSSFSPH